MIETFLNASPSHPLEHFDIHALDPSVPNARTIPNAVMHYLRLLRVDLQANFCSFGRNIFYHLLDLGQRTSNQQDVIRETQICQAGPQARTNFNAIFLRALLGFHHSHDFLQDRAEYVRADWVPLLSAFSNVELATMKITLHSGMLPIVQSGENININVRHI